MSGSCRKKARSARAKPSPGLSCTLTWFVLHVDLVDVRHLNFTGVFDGSDVDLRSVEPVQAGIQRLGFAGSGGARDKHHAVGPLDGVFEQSQVLCFVTQCSQVQLDLTRVEHAHHHLFAKQRGQGADAQIQMLASWQWELHASVLRQAFFGDIESCHDLDAGGQPFTKRQRCRSHFMQLPVNAHAHPVMCFVGLETQVRCVQVNRLFEQTLHIHHHRGVFDLPRFSHAVQREVGHSVSISENKRIQIMKGRCKFVKSEAQEGWRATEAVRVAPNALKKTQR